MVLIIEMVQQKKISSNFSKAKKKFCLSLHDNNNENYFVRK